MEKPTANILNGEKLNAFPLKIKKKTRRSAISTAIKNFTRGSSQDRKSGEKKADHNGIKGETKGKLESILN